MKTIYKYQIKIDDSQQVETHRFCTPLSVQMQNGVPCMWVMVDTGHAVPDNFYVGGDHNMFLGTIQLSGLVFMYLLMVL